MNKVEIYSSKKKSFFLLIASLAFVALGMWFLLQTDDFTRDERNPIWIRGIGIASILFFGPGIYIAVKRLIKSEIALIISNDGLNINPKKSSTDLIRWNDILGFTEIKIHSTRIVIIAVKNPQYWVAQETNSIRKKLMQFNINNYGSPFNIAASGLDISSGELLKTLSDHFERSKAEI